MSKIFSIAGILGINEPEVVVLSSDSEAEDNEAEINKIETIPLSTNNDGGQMVEVGIFMLDFFSCNTFTFALCYMLFVPLSLVFIHFFILYIFSQRISLIAHCLLHTFKF